MPDAGIDFERKIRRKADFNQGNSEVVHYTRTLSAAVSKLKDLISLWPYLSNANHSIPQHLIVRTEFFTIPIRVLVHASNEWKPFCAAYFTSFGELFCLEIFSDCLACAERRVGVGTMLEGVVSAGERGRGDENERLASLDGGLRSLGRALIRDEHCSHFNWSSNES